MCAAPINQPNIDFFAVVARSGHYLAYIAGSETPSQQADCLHLSCAVHRYTRETFFDFFNPVPPEIIENFPQKRSLLDSLQEKCTAHFDSPDQHDLRNISDIKRSLRTRVLPSYQLVTDRHHKKIHIDLLNESFSLMIDIDIILVVQYAFEKAFSYCKPKLSFAINTPNGQAIVTHPCRLSTYLPDQVALDILKNRYHELEGVDQDEADDNSLTHCEELLSEGAENGDVELMRAGCLLSQSGKIPKDWIAKAYTTTKNQGYPDLSSFLKKIISLPEDDEKED